MIQLYRIQTYKTSGETYWIRRVDVDIVVSDTFY